MEEVFLQIYNQQRGTGDIELGCDYCPSIRRSSTEALLNDGMIENADRSAGGPDVLITDLDDNFGLNGRVSSQRGNADGRARVTAALAPKVDQ